MKRLLPCAARTACVFQEPRLLPWLSAEENVSIVIPHGTQGQDALMLLKELGLADSAEKHPCELSGGMQKRVGLARAIAADPQIIFFDEPTTGLHFQDIEVLLGTLFRLRDAGNTLIVIEHNLDVIRCADWIIDLGPEGGAAGGEIIAEGPPEQIAACAASETGRFLRASPPPRRS